MNRLYILAFAALVLNAAEIKAQWQTFSNANTVVLDVNCLTFVNGTVGFAGGTSYYSAHACVSKTEDGGRTWRTVWPDSGYWAGGYLGIAGMALVGDTTLWAVYDDNVVVIDARANTVLRTMIEFGIDVARCYDRIITDIEVIDDSIIVMSVCNGVLLSTNAGSQWRYVEVTRGKPYRISFSDRWHGFLLVDRGGIYRTSDGGNTWLPARSGSVNGEEHDVLRISPERGVAVGSGIAITQDSGQTWIRPEQPSGIWYSSSVVSVDDTLLWCSAADGIVHSTDAGATWHYQFQHADASVTAMYAVGSDTVHAAGEQDHYFTSNSGRTPSSFHESTSPLDEMWRCSVFPNPVTEGFTISSEKCIERYRIVDALGSVVQDVSTDVRSGDRMRVEVDCGVLANRAYVVVVSAGGTERTIPIVVCR